MIKSLIHYVDELYGCTDKQEIYRMLLEFEQDAQAIAERTLTTHYSLSEKPISKEATHAIKCPSCSGPVNIPCINYQQAQFEDLQ